MSKFKVTIPYWDSGNKKRFEIEFTVSAENEEKAKKKAVNHFNKYEGYSMASWLRLIYEKEINVEKIE